MGSNSKLQKLPCCDEDRISYLPDSILSHILSFLPTKFAVATAVLSTRWKYLWISLRNLDFDDSLSMGRIPLYSNPRHKLSFMNFVDRVLMLSDNALNLDTFNLDCRGNCDLTRVRKWVCVAIEQSVRQIKLSLNLRDPFELPSSFFTCKTLVNLRLYWKIFIDVPKQVHFPSLKVLHFCGVKFSHCDSIQKLVLGCPVLEELSIRKCIWPQGHTLKVCGLALKSLTLHLHANIECKTVVDAQTLEFLDIQDYSSETFLMMNLCSLVKANVDVARKYERSLPFGEYSSRVFELLRGISNVKFLSLSHDTMETISYAYGYDFPTFYNLTRLELGVYAWCGCTFLPNLLASSPILESIVFAEGLTHPFHFQRGNHRINWSPLEELVANCLLLHLKEIEIRNFRGVAEELKLVKYFLKNAKVLKKMSIDCSFLKEDVKVQKKLLRFPRGSASCQLDLMF